MEKEEDFKTCTIASTSVVFTMVYTSHFENSIVTSSNHRPHFGKIMEPMTTTRLSVLIQHVDSMDEIESISSMLECTLNFQGMKLKPTVDTCCIAMAFARSMAVQR